MDMAVLTAGGQLMKVNRTLQRTTLKMRKMQGMRGSLAHTCADTVRAPAMPAMQCSHLTDCCCTPLWCALMH
jgi:hypothetical protein